MRPRAFSLYLKTFICFLLLTASYCNAQKDSVKNNVYTTSIDIQYGQRILQKSYLNNGLNSFDNFNFGSPISYLGISLTGAFKLDGAHSEENLFHRIYNGQVSYSQIIPQDVILNDSITGKLTGFNFGYTILGFDVFKKSKAFDLIIDLGFNTGRLRMYGNELIKQKNPYFSPAISITPRIRIGKMSFHIRGNYDYDISKKHWRRTFMSKTEKVPIGETKLSGIMILGGIGFILE